MPNVRDYAGANFVKFDDLQDGPLREQIAAVNPENGQFGKRWCWPSKVVGSFL